MRMQPEIAAIPEMWHEKHAILDRLNQVSGNVYAFATGGNTEQFNDADILFPCRQVGNTSPVIWFHSLREGL